MFDAFTTFDSLDLANLLCSLCDVVASTLAPSSLPFPPQKSPKKEEETLRLGPFTPRLPPTSNLPSSPMPLPPSTPSLMPATCSEDTAHPHPIVLARCFQPFMITSSLPSPPPPFPLFFLVLFISFSPSLPMSGSRRFNILNLLLQCLLPFPPLSSPLNFFDSAIDLILIDHPAPPSTILRCLQERPKTKRCLQGFSEQVVALELKFDRALGSSRYKWRAEIKEAKGGERFDRKSQLMAKISVGTGRLCEHALPWSLEAFL